MTAVEEPVVLIAVADTERAARYAEWLPDGYEPRTVHTTAAAIEALDSEPAFVLLERWLPEQHGTAVLREIRERGLGCRVAVLTEQETAVPELDVDAVRPFPATAAGLESLLGTLRDAAGLDRAIRAYQRLAERRATLAADHDDEALADHAEYRTLTAKLEQHRDRIEAALDRVADHDADDERVESAAAQTELPPDPRDQLTGPIERFLHSDGGPWLWFRAGLVPFLLVLLIFGLLVAATGTWPAVVGVSSDSMAPHITPGDLVILTAPDRYAPEFAPEGIVSYQDARAQGYRSLGSYGSVVVFQQPGATGSATIHRVRFSVEAGENWVDRANESFLISQNCATVKNCPAPHAGYITKGDNNDRYDQSSGLAPPVKRDWIMGVARYRIPLGAVRDIVVRGATAGLVAPP